MDAPEVIIVGGGPAGSVLASCLSLRGRRALVLERERFPRFHVGESLLPFSREVLERIGVGPELDARYLRKYGARFLCSSTQRQARYCFDQAFDPRYPFSYQVPRADFDDLLLRHAQKLGAEVHERWEVAEVLFEGDRVVGVRALDLEAGVSHTLRAPFVVDATGRDALFATHTRQKKLIAELGRTALFTHFSGIPRAHGLEGGDIRVVLFDGGWAWFIPLRGDVTSVGAVLTAEWLRAQERGLTGEELFARALGGSSWARELLAPATQLRPIYPIPDFSYRIDQLAGPGFLFVGDAGGFLDPVFSTGAHLAIKGADLAADALARALDEPSREAAILADYEAAIRQAVDLFLGVVQGFYRGEFRELLFEPAQRPTMRRLITTILAGDVFHGASRPPWVPFLRERFAPRPPALVTA